MDRLHSPITSTGHAVTLPPLESFAMFKDKLSQTREQQDDEQTKEGNMIEYKRQNDSGKRKFDETDNEPAKVAKKPKIWSISEIIS